MTTQDLIARLEGAGRGSLALDEAILKALGFSISLDWTGGWWGRDGRRLHHADSNVSRSLGSTLALAELVLGDDWAIHIEKRPHWSGGPTWSAHVTDGCIVREDWLAPTPAFALCIAILKACSAQSAEPAKEAVAS